MQPHSSRVYYEIPAGPAGGNLVSARQPSGDLGRNTGFGSKWSRRCCGCATGAVAPITLFTVCIADSEKLHGAMAGGPCTAHAQGPHDFPFHQPFHGGSYHREKAGGRGTRNPMGSAALGDLQQRDQCGGKPPVPAVRLRRFRCSRNAPGSTASLLAVLPPKQPWRHAATIILEANEWVW
ncbi:hypothetical protein NDU88_009826 [Pleurodeles waltl]|uniref:Uncharacterized protein n=1 Tax=Pleurodeles waltl TaxID=8319 RepID=A0AAV7RX79_PLEWA|nr:hypothetical protein NDU88_009826 [Pleurodeles waltl]